MNSTVTKIKNRTITLPKEMSRLWSNKDIVIFSGDNRLIIEPFESFWKQSPLSPREMMDSFRAAAKKTGLKKSAALLAVKEVRKRMYGKA